jgi:hypothetical protein
VSTVRSQGKTWATSSSSFFFFFFSRVLYVTKTMPSAETSRSSSTDLVNSMHVLNLMRLSLRFRRSQPATTPQQVCLRLAAWRSAALSNKYAERDCVATEREFVASEARVGRVCQSEKRLLGLWGDGATGTRENKDAFNGNRLTLQGTGCTGLYGIPLASLTCATVTS